MKQKLVIWLDDEHTTEETLEEVTRLVRDGFTSGIDPEWDLTGGEDDE